jgi:hypothetical protein
MSNKPFFFSHHLNVLCISTDLHMNRAMAMRLLDVKSDLYNLRFIMPI